MLSNILVNGMIAGSLYALLAVGFALIFSVAGIINIAHTAFYMVGAFLDMGAPSGWDKVRHEGTKDYVLPPRVVDYWTDN